MSVDLQTMRSEARQIIGETDTQNSHFPESQLNTWANEFYRRMCIALETLPITERSYTIGTTISLNSGTISVDHAKIYIRPSNQWRTLRIIDIDELFLLDPNWENATTAEPSYLIRTGTFTARLYPPPNSANDGQLTSVKTFGLEMPTSLSSDTDVPDLPVNIQDLFKHWIAYKCFERLGDERWKDQLVLVNGIIKEQKGITTRFSKSRGWRWQDSDQNRGIGDSDC